MLSETYLHAGLTALARAEQHAWAQGHFACACLATFFMAKERELPADTEDAIRVELDKMMASRAHLFVPIELAEPDPNELERVPAALEPSIEKLCHGGHNVIYAALGLKGLMRAPEMVCAPIVDGIVRLLEVVGNLPEVTSFHAVDVSDMTGEPDGDLPEYDSIETVAEITFREMLRFDPMYYEIQGETGHLATQAHALVELERLGYPDLARRGHVAHRLHLRHVRLLHDHFDKSLWTVVDPAAADPMDPAFWAADIEALAASSWGFSHFFKYRYQLYDLLKLVRDPEFRDRIIERLPDLIMNDFRAQNRSPKEFLVPIK